MTVALHDQVLAVRDVEAAEREEYDGLRNMGVDDEMMAMEGHAPGGRRVHHAGFASAAASAPKAMRRTGHMAALSGADGVTYAEVDRSKG